MSDLTAATPASLEWPALKSAFAGQPEFTRAAVLAFYRRADPMLNSHTFDSRLRQLVRRGLLLATGRGRYALVATAPLRAAFQPTLSRAERTSWRVLIKELQIPEGCLWSTAWVNEFSIHQAARSLLIVEVPRDYVHTAFFALQERYPHRVFLQPRPDMLTHYVAQADRPLVVLPFVRRAPVQLEAGVPVPRLEKLLVDLFSRPDLFPAYQGHELVTIFRHARRHYRLDERTLLSYAARRHQARELHRFLRQLPDWPIPATA